MLLIKFKKLECFTFKKSDKKAVQFYHLKLINLFNSLKTQIELSLND